MQTQAWAENWKFPNPSPSRALPNYAWEKLKKLNLLEGGADLKSKQRRSIRLFCYPVLEFLLLVPVLRNNKFYNRNVIEATKAFTF